MKINTSLMVRRLRHVRNDLMYWSQRSHLYRDTSYPHSAHKRKVERKVRQLQEEELRLMEELGELSDDITYLPPGEQLTVNRSRHWKNRKF